MVDAKPSHSVPPRVLIVSRRTVRKNKFVDFVGEYHLELLVKYGVLPIIVPRVEGLHHLLEGYEPIHGVLLCEGEDVDPSLYYDSDPANLNQDDLSEIRRLHSNDVAIDQEKDSIELQLARQCMDNSIPILGICRGSQILNVACGGSLYQDVEMELCGKLGTPIKHLNYDDYDGHRHPITVLKGTPLHNWFFDSLNPHDMEMSVNSYHHQVHAYMMLSEQHQTSWGPWISEGKNFLQGVKGLAATFKAMAFSPCGLIEAFYKQDAYDPCRGKFTVGLQFHPERMRQEQVEEWRDVSQESSFDYPGCLRVYEDFSKAVIAYQNSMNVDENEHAVLQNKMAKYLLENASPMKNLYHHIVSMKRHDKICTKKHTSNVCIKISRSTTSAFTTTQPNRKHNLNINVCLCLKISQSTIRTFSTTQPNRCIPMQNHSRLLSHILW